MADDVRGTNPPLGVDGKPVFCLWDEQSQQRMFYFSVYNGYVPENELIDDIGTGPVPEDEIDESELADMISEGWRRAEAGEEEGMLYPPKPDPASDDKDPASELRTVATLAPGEIPKGTILLGDRMRNEQMKDRRDDETHQGVNKSSVLNPRKRGREASQTAEV